ncbi:MAG: metal-dependent transcriptional regulator [Deltaproteobacteria bacterium]|nr:metal-dependent transcriptional regulator [Deltaproteobacteria bacterium]
MQLSESLENYLEVILDLENAHKVARAKDIAEKLGIQRGSVTGALKNLVEKKLINYEPYSFITLTDKGARIAKAVTRRHMVLKGFLSRVLQLDEETAEAGACRMEHAIDEVTINRLVCFVEFLFRCPRTGDDWIQEFIEFCKTGQKDTKECDQCLDDCKQRYNSRSGSSRSGSHLNY